MNNVILEVIDEDTAAQVAALLADFDELKVKVEAVRRRVQQAAVTVQIIRSGGANASTVRGELDALIRVDTLLRPLASDFLEGIGYDVDGAATIIQDVQSGLADPGSLAPAEIQKLKTIIDGFDRARATKPEVEAVGKVFSELIDQQVEEEFDVDGNKVTVLLRSRPAPGKSPFHPEAAMEAEVVYAGGFRATLTGIRLRVEPGQNGGKPFPDIDWNKARIKLQGLDLDTAIGLLQGAIAELDFPGPVQFKNPRLVGQGQTVPREVLVDLTFGGIPLFEDLQFSAGLRILANGQVKASSGASVTIPGFFPIGTTPFAFDTITIGYKAPPPDAMLEFGTKIVPAAPGAGQIVALKPTVTIFLKHPEEGITINGFLLLLTQTLGSFDGQLSTTKIHGHVLIPVAGGVAVFAGAFFRLDAECTLDETGLSCDGTVEMFKAFNGKMQAVIGFNGAGFVNGDAKALLSDAHVSASWKPGMKDLVAGADTSVDVEIAGAKVASASVRLDAKVDGVSPKTVRVRTQVLGVEIDDNINPASTKDVRKFIQSKVDADRQKAIDFVFDMAKPVLKDLDIFNQKGALRRTLADLDIFNGNSEARQILQNVGEAFDRFGVQIGKLTSVERWKAPFQKEHFTQVGNPILASIPQDLEAEKKTLLELCEALDKTEIKVVRSAGENDAPETDGRIESGVVFKFDQVLGTIVDFRISESDNPVASWTEVVAFLVNGTTFKRRASQAKQSNVAVWVKIQFDIFQERVFIPVKITLPEFRDESILGARQLVYRAAKDVVIKIFGEDQINFGETLSDFDNRKDPNDPGPPPKFDPRNFPPTPVEIGVTPFDPGKPISFGQDFDPGTPIGTENNIDPGTPIGSSNGGFDTGTPLGSFGSDFDPGTPN